MLRARTLVSFQLADPSFDHDYRLLWFRAGVFLSKRHPAEGPSISSGKKDCLNGIPQQLQNLSTTDTAVQAGYFKMFCCLLRKRMLVKTQGTLWVDFKKETLFFYEGNHKLLPKGVYKNHTQVTLSHLCICLSKHTDFYFAVHGSCCLKLVF